MIYKVNVVPDIHPLSCICGVATLFVTHKDTNKTMYTVFSMLDSDYMGLSLFMNKYKVERRIIQLCIDTLHYNVGF